MSLAGCGKNTRYFWQPLVPVHFTTVLVVLTCRKKFLGVFEQSKHYDCFYSCQSYVVYNFVFCETCLSV